MKLISISKILLLTVMSIILLYLILSKIKEKKINIDGIKKIREPNTNKQIIPYSNKERRETIKKNQRRTHSIDKDLNEEYKDMQEYVYMAIKGTLYNPNEVFKKSENPKISIIITVYNGEGYLKTALISIQNQDFKDIEIIMVDDGSKDNSVNLIKELMIKDPRIILYQNKENKGMLYAKTRGVLNAKGKYVMMLDIDDMYAQRDAFSTLYQEAEENNLDILGFGLIISKNIIQKYNKKIRNYLKTGIINKSNVPNSMYECNSYNCKRKGGLTSVFLFRTDLFVDIIKQIDDKFMNVKMNFFDDLLMFFLLSRKARNLRQIKRIFYIIIKWPQIKNNKILFRIKEKNKNSEDNRCLCYISYLEFILIKTKNNIIDKKIPSLELKNIFLHHRCRNNKNIRERAKKVLELFLKNDYIAKDIKNEIFAFLNETKQNAKKVSKILNLL